jgi:hypothetical protein
MYNLGSYLEGIQRTKEILSQGSQYLDKNSYLLIIVSQRYNI